MCNKVLNLKTFDLLNLHCLTHSALETVDVVPPCQENYPSSVESFLFCKANLAARRKGADVCILQSLAREVRLTLTG